MGIHGLAKLLGDKAPGGFREQQRKNYFGRKVAIDASMHIYQFMVVVGRMGDQLLTDNANNVTSHLQGLFYRTTMLMQEGIKPVFVFDGKPPELKSQELARRAERRGEATAAQEAAREAGNQEALEKYSKRTVKVTREHNEECKRLLSLMGVPYVEAPAEAEAQCCSMAKAGLVDVVATEDMDALTFGAPRLVRNMMNPASKDDAGAREYEYTKLLEELKITSDQFVDLCILCGCDYCGRIPGIGPVRALELVKQHGNLETIVEKLDKTKYPLPEPFPFEQARKLFKEPEVTPPENLEPLKWKKPDVDGLVQFLVHEKSFSEDRVRKAADRLLNSKDKANQQRLEDFFGASKIVSSSKRKEPEPKGKGKGKGPPSKKGKAGGVGKK